MDLRLHGGRAGAKGVANTVFPKVPVLQRIHSASKTRVNALVVLRCARET
jgi:hypothetical protein